MKTIKSTEVGTPKDFDQWMRGQKPAAPAKPKYPISHELDYERLDHIVETIKDELRTGARDHWGMDFDDYVDERMGDLDWQGGMGGPTEEEDNDPDYDDDDYERAKKYVIDKVVKNLGQDAAQ